MCLWGTDVEVMVPMPASLSHTGAARWAVKGVDSCIAPLVEALNVAGLHTANSCCGHGREPGQIILHDGRVVGITTDEVVQMSSQNERPPFDLHVRVEWNEENECYIASSDTAPFTLISGHGDTREDALRQFGRVLVTVLADGQKLPPY